MDDVEGDRINHVFDDDAQHGVGPTGIAFVAAVMLARGLQEFRGRFSLTVTTRCVTDRKLPLKTFKRNIRNQMHDKETCIHLNGS